jgi:hypothetical protein
VNWLLLCGGARIRYFSPGHLAGRRTPVRARAGRPGPIGGAGPVTRDSRALGEMRQIVAGNGAGYLKLDLLTDGLIESGNECRKAADSRRVWLLDADSALEPYPIKMGTPRVTGKATGKFPGRGVSTREGA